MVINAAGYEEWLDAVGVERVLVGFPGFAGAAVGPVVEYVDVPVFLQKTMIGEPDGSITPRLLGVAHLLRRAGLRAFISRNMDAWQKTHAAIVVPLAAGLCGAEDWASALAYSPEAVRLIVRSVRECFAIFSELHVPITPARAKLLKWLPDRLLENLLLWWAHTREFEVLVARHARIARDEMACLSDQLLALARRTCVDTPALNTLHCHLTPGPPQEKDAPRTTVSV
jgi:2-dehydropantoate 2-reductase